MTDTRLAIIVIVALATLTAYLYRNIVHIAIIQAGLVLSIAPAIIASFKWKISASGLKNALLAGVLVVIYWIFKGQIEVQTMFSSVFASSIVLFFTEKYQRRKKLS